MGDPHHENQSKSYQSFVAASAQWNPDLKNLSEVLQSNSLGQRACHIVCLAFSSTPGPPRRQSLDLDSLASTLSTPAARRDGILGRLLIIEDITTEIVETLGCLLNIDPFFFASHIDTFRIDVARARPSMANLPSIMRTQNFLNLHYHRVVEIENPESTHELLRDMNVPRVVRVLSKFKGTNIGLVRHCCSILEAKGKDGLWIGMKGLTAQSGHNHKTY